MTTSLIRFDKNHISTAQVVMADDRVLEGFMHNLVKPPIIEIRGYLQEAGFLHTCCILRGCKLDPKLINALVERWRPETHTFHPLYDECTVTLEDVALQLDLPVDGPVIMGATIVPNKEDLCAALLGKVPNKFKGGQISMNWLDKNFQKLPPHTTKVANSPSRLQRMQTTELGISRVGHIIPGVV
ncbi:serine/threonine-protein phosphatase 7 long form-like protein [Gossypium australe]|uniref:Serine/threonine-protein phosphatase 7 long form-like protein n=1 Tax=Gossypium australe TaxID=47621 RepID=A0A5B6UAT7_9ROSI|nr:serine/threonine-protein phosphatase 7 long form-like protein [Gossypium australe]